MLLSKQMRVVFTCVCLAFGLSMPPAVLGQCEPTELIGSDTASEDRFGGSVATDGLWAVIGASSDDDQGAYSGSAFVFRRHDGGTPGDPSDDTWSEERKLLALAGASGDRFGMCASISGDRIVIGAPYQGFKVDLAGAAYVFRLSDNGTPQDPSDDRWVQERRLKAPDPAVHDRFGTAVSIDGDRVAVGISYDDDIGNDSGSVFVFQRVGTDWELESKITAPDGAEDDHFGDSVSLSGDRLAVGAPQHNAQPGDRGAAYVFRHEGSEWVLESKLVSSDFTRFGDSISLLGDLLVIGDHEDDDAGSNAGAAHLYRRVDTIWQQEAKLIASDASSSDRFGYSVFAADGLVVVGAAYADVGGAAYVFRQVGPDWVQAPRFDLADPASSDGLGASVGVGGNVAIVGAPGRDAVGHNSGSAYLLLVGGGDEDNDGVVDICDICPGGDDHVDGDGDGVPDFCDPCPLDNPDDTDGDGVCDSDDLCPGYDDSLDDDGDGVPDGCDACPGYDDNIDTDGDGVPDDCDPCPNDNPDDSDADGVCDSDDLCPGYNDNIDSDGDGLPDGCDTSICEVAQLTAPDADDADRLGEALAVSGDRCLIGVHRHLSRAPEDGIAYVYQRLGDAWELSATLKPAEYERSLYLGHSVALEGDLALVGAPGDDHSGYTNAGSAYAYKWDGTEWIREAVLTASDPSQLATFGHSVSLSGDLAVVGAPNDDEAGNNAGAAYVFRRVSGMWTEEAKLLPPPYASYSAESVAVDGERVAVGCHMYSYGGGPSGRVFVHRYDGAEWVMEAQLQASDVTNFSWFGYSIALNGDRLVAGAYADDVFGSASGAVFVFRRDGTTWNQEAKLVNVFGAEGDWLGFSVAFEGNRVIAGAHGDDDAGAGTGSAVIFRHEGALWWQEAIVTSSDAAPHDRFGQAVATDNDLLVIGAPRDDDAAPGAGAAYVYLLENDFTDSDGDGVADLCDICPGFDDNVDSDNDDVPDGCDLCPGYDDNIDSDADGVPDGCDVCPGGDDTIDSDGDGIPDPCDPTAPCELVKLTADDAADGQEFGWAVAIHGDRAAVGAPYDNEAGHAAGAVYVLRREGVTWVQEAKLITADAHDVDTFGYSVSISGDRVVAGAPNNDGAGSVHVFRRDGDAWVEEARLMAADANLGAKFGWSVSIDGDYVLVGANRDSATLYRSGAAYVFHHDGVTWNQQAKLTASDAAEGDWFGHSVDLNGDLAVIGAIYSDAFAADAGAAYIFEREGANWLEEATLGASDAQASDQFGHSVSIDSDRVAIGLYRYDDAKFDTGSVYIYRHDFPDWIQEAQLAASDAERYDQFGVRISLKDDRLAIGAHHDDVTGIRSGSAYIFHYDGTEWIEENKLIPDEGMPLAYFGVSVGIEGGFAIVGAEGDNTAGAHAGAAYVFQATAVLGDCNCDGVLNEFDIEFFIDALLLTDDDWETQYPDCPKYCAADTNGDGRVNGFDIDSFVARLAVLP